MFLAGDWCLATKAQLLDLREATARLAGAAASVLHVSIGGCCWTTNPCGTLISLLHVNLLKHVRTLLDAAGVSAPEDSSKP